MLGVQKFSFVVGVFLAKRSLLRYFWNMPLSFYAVARSFHSRDRTKRLVSRTSRLKLDGYL